MTSVELTDADWQQVLSILAMAPWRDANPLMMKIGSQLQAHAHKQDQSRMDGSSPVPN